MEIKQKSERVKKTYLKESIARLKTIKRLPEGYYIEGPTDPSPHIIKGTHIEYSPNETYPGHTVGFWEIDLKKEIERVQKIVESNGGKSETIWYISKWFNDTYDTIVITIHGES